MSLMHRAGRPAAGLALSVALTVALTGCDGSSPPASDASVAKATLVAALDAWKAGTPIDAHAQANPGLTVVDKYWQGGAKLKSYEIDGDGRPDGFDIGFTVRLKYADGKSDKHPFAVSTAPKLVIVHLEPGG